MINTLKSKNLNLRSIFRWLTATRRRKILSSFLAVLILISGIRFAFFRPKEARADWYDDSWHYRKKIVIDDSQVNGASDLTNFPVLISFTTDSQLSAKAQTDADDILFADLNGIKLDHEIEKYTSGTGELVAWVRIPTLYTSSDTVIFLYYGNPLASNQENAAGVWDSSYLGVWHLGETVTDEQTAGTHSDSTSPSENGTQNNNASTTGKIGGAQNFDGTSDWVNMGDVHNLGDGTDITMSGWINWSSNGQAQSFFAKKASNLNTAAGYYLDANPTGRINMYVADGTDQVWRGDTTGVSAGSWFYFTGVFDESDINGTKIYRNGVDDTGSTTGTIGLVGSLASTSALRIGCRSAGTFCLQGSLDEVRLSNTVRSADWIRTEYNNQNSPSTFYSLNSEEKSASPNLFLMFDEGYGTSTQDQTEFNNDGSISGASWKTRDLCLSENCLFFDGVDDVVTVTNTNSIDMDQQLAGALTYQTWIRANSDGEANTGAVFNKGTSSRMRIENEGSDGFADLTASLDLSTTDATITITNGITLGKWHHVAFSYTNDADDEITVYIDGVIRGTSTNGSGAPAADANNLLIGGSTTTNFNGFIDNFKIYNKERSATEIKTDYLRITGTKGSSASFGERNYSTLSNGLVGYWKMDEVSWTNDCATNTVGEFSGNNLTGDSCPTTTGPTGGAAGRFGSAGNFDGTDDYINIGDQAKLELEMPLTVSAWINLDSLPSTDENYCIITKYDSSGSREWRLCLNTSNQLFFYTSEDGGAVNEHAATSSTVFTSTDLGLWKHVVISADSSGSWKMFINGNEDNSGSFTSTTIYNGTANVEIGATSRSSTTPDHFFDGKLDEIRIYNRAFSPVEVSLLYNWAPEPIVYYNFDEAGQTTTLYDRSTNQLNGTMTGMEANNWEAGKYGNTYNYDGNDDFVNFYSAGFESKFNKNYGTLMFWFRIKDAAVWNDGSSDFAVRIESADTFNEVYVVKDGASPGTVRLEREANSINKNATYNTGGSTDWFHAAISWDTAEDEQKYYINGVLLETDTGIGTWTNALSSNLVTIASYGVSPSNQEWIGNIDEVKIYDYARSGVQIIEDMNAGHPAPGSPVGSPMLNLRFDEGYGDTAYDMSGHDNNGNLGDTTSCPAAGDNACPSWTNNGVRGKALDFDIAGTTDDIVTATSSSSTLNLTGAMTISAWVNLDTNATSQTIVSRNYQGSTRSYSLRVNGSVDQKTEFHISPDCVNETDVFSSAAAPTGQWVHWVGVYEPSNALRLYKNGVLDGIDTVSIPAAQCANNQPVGIGRRPPGATAAFALDGKLDDVQIYNFALTAEQVKVLYNQSSSAVLGSTSTTSGGTSDWSASREYCIPGDSTTCNPPVLEWKFDEGTGTVSTYDTSTNNFTGTLNSITESSWLVGKQGNALDFDGTVDYVDGGDQAALDFADGGDFTVEAWFYRDSETTNDFMINKRNGWGAADIGYSVGFANATDDLLYYEVSDGTDQYQVIGSTAITTPGWHHVAFVFDDASDAANYIYLDGIPERSSSSGGAALALIGSISTAATFRVAASSGTASNHFDGKLDFVKVYNYARTTAQIAWDYNKGEPVGWWKFDDCQSATAADLSGNGNDGTIVPGATGNTAAGSCNSGVTTEMWNNGTTGKRNASLDFDGVSDYVTIPDADELDFADSEPFTVTAWVKPSTDSTGTVINKDSSWEIVFNASSNWFAFGEDGADSIQCSESGSVNPGVWYLVVAIHSSSGDARCSINAGRVYSRSGVTPSENANPYNIGRDYDGGTGVTYFDGQIDDLRFYNYRLTSQQINTLYNDGAVHFE